MRQAWDVSLQSSSPPNKFLWSDILSYRNKFPYIVVYLVSEIILLFHIHDAEPSSNFHLTAEQNYNDVMKTQLRSLPSEV